MEIHAVIMAGGAGTRLWPISRQNRPKQYIALGQEKCMLVQTLERLYTFIPPEKCHIITNRDQQEILMKALHDLTVSPGDSLADTIATQNLLLPAIIYEPLGKNTAACITYSALLLKKQVGNCMICFIPADSLINDAAAYRATLETAFREAGSGIWTDGGLIIVGVTPSYPATGYGYIKPISDSGGSEVRQVERFLEKPDAEQANELYSSGRYLWNSGIVIGQADSILDKVRMHLPEHYSRLYDAVYNGGDLAQAYEAVDNISFDYGVLEKCKDIYVIKSSFDWDDIGSVDALDKIHGRDHDGNTVIGCYLGMDVKDSVVYSKQGLIAAMGIDNMIIVNTEDVVLVCPRDRVQDIKKLVAVLKQNGFGRYT